MKKLLGILAILAMAAPVAAQNQKQTFGIGDSSIFSRDRSAPAAAATTGPTTASAKASGPAPVLIGAIKDDSGFVGFLEIRSQNGSNVISIKPGDTIAWDGSKVSEISLDEIHLTGGTESKSVVTVGNDLRNEAPTWMPDPAHAAPNQLGITPADGRTNGPAARRTGRPRVLIIAPGATNSR